MYGLLRMLGRFHAARAQGKGLHSQEIQALEPVLTDSMVQEMLGQLCLIGLLSRAESGEWLLARISTISRWANFTRPANCGFPWPKRMFRCATMPWASARTSARRIAPAAARIAEATRILDLYEPGVSE
jgi:hypothetical protein